ncbi:MAG: 3-deoxy-D-manno-octulosonate 8-phosphate phosphatase, partial [Brachymonas sp.]|nr:3-deoxy-D-manno-octulosonate 8-phosphate phosphatase [Brachymonas sp.]
EKLLATLGLEWAQAFAMGDDWPDLPLLARAACPAAPPNVHAEVRSRALHVTQAAGGAGAVRELCDLLLQACGRYADLLRDSFPSPATERAP